MLSSWDSYMPASLSVVRLQPSGLRRGLPLEHLLPGPGLLPAFTPGHPRILAPGHGTACCATPLQVYRHATACCATPLQVRRVKTQHARLTTRVTATREALQQLMGTWAPRPCKSVARERVRALSLCMARSSWCTNEVVTAEASAGS
jgi:hypothetical protein